MPGSFSAGGARPLAWQDGLPQLMLHCSKKGLEKVLCLRIYTAVQQRRPPMAQVATSTVKRPELKLPKLDLKAVFARHQANLAAAQEAQAVLLDAAQAIAKLQADHAQTLITRARDGLATQAPRQPEAVLGEVEATVEKTFATARQSLELGLAAQRRVAELVAARARANLEQFQALAA
jgi:hypothetical protein